MKTCTICHQTKPIFEFNKQTNCKDGLQSKCRQCNQACSRRYYANNKEHVKTVVNINKRKRRLELRTKINLIKKESGCFFCTENEPICLDFHHINPKDKSFLISTVALHFKWETVVQEINKCKVICANCHRKLHAGILKIIADGQV